MNIKEININDLIISPLNVRKNLKDNIEDLSNNIKQHGLLNPLTVVLNKSQNKYEIIAGQRRYLAIKKLNKQSISCNIVDKKENECIFISIIENLQRNSMTLSNKVRMYQKLYNNFNYSSDTLSEKINVSKETINTYLKLSSLSDEILDRLDRPKNSTEKISLEFASYIVTLPITDDNELLEIIKIFDDTNSKEKTEMMRLLKTQINSEGNNFNIKYINSFKIKYEKIKKMEKENRIEKINSEFETIIDSTNYDNELKIKINEEFLEKNIKEKEKMIKLLKDKIDHNDNKFNIKYVDKLKNKEIIKKKVINEKKEILIEKKEEIIEKENIKRYTHNNYLVRNPKLQNEYRTRIKNRYTKCIISDMFDDICEAAHIIPFTDSNDKECFDINNGILLNRILHKLFDNFDISINPESLNVEIKKTCRNYEFIKMYDNKHIKILSNYPKTIEYLRQHYEKFNVIKS